MLYVLELGPIEQDIAKQAVRSGQPIPDRILNAPRLSDGLSFYLQAFFDLDAERSQGFATGRIPWLSVIKYAEHYELDKQEADALAYLIRVMDVAHLKRLAEERKA